MAKHRWYTYIDFLTGNIRRTRGKFSGWITDGLSIRRAVFQLRSSAWFVPEWCLTDETRAAIAEAKETSP